MGTAANWLREERRRTLGDWVAFCPACGHAQRYFEGDEALLPASCPTCRTPFVVTCPACGSRVTSVFAVDCEGCGHRLRPAIGFGVPVRRSARPA